MHADKPNNGNIFQLFLGGRENHDSHVAIWARPLSRTALQRASSQEGCTHLAAHPSQALVPKPRPLVPASPRSLSPLPGRELGGAKQLSEMEMRCHCHQKNHG